MRKKFYIGDFEITVYDFSQGSGYPVVGTLLINRDTQDYALNVSADPVLEIALSRGLTEILQGKKLNYFSSRKSDKPFFEDSSLTVSHNLINQHETNSGLLGVKFFTESPSEDDVSTFADNSNKTNSELLSYALNLFKGIGKPVYVRNYSFLGFPTYKFVVPGFSETRGFWFTEDIQEYGLGDILAKVLRNPANANIADLNFALIYFAKIQGVLSRKDSFSRLAGLNITGKFTNVLLYSSVSYAAYKLGRYLEASRYLKKLLSENYTENEPLSLSERRYLQILCKYLDLAAKKTPPEKIRIMLNKFFDKDTVSLLYQKIESGENLYEGFLLECDTKNCEKCAQNSICTYNKVKDIIKRAGEYYNKFTDGQNKENFAF